MTMPPTIFDSFTQGFQRGQDIKREQEERRRQDAAQALQVILSMQQSGNATAQDVSSFLAQNEKLLPSGLKGMQVQKLQPEMRQDILKGGIANIPISAAFGTPILPLPMDKGGKVVTSDMRRNAGLPSYEQMEGERLGVTAAKQGIERNQQQIDIGQEELTPQGISARSQKRIADIVNQSAPGYIDRAVNRAGGWKRFVQGGVDAAGQKQSPEQFMATVGDAAMKDFEANAKLGNLDEGQQEFVKAVMHTALLDRQLQAVQAQARLMEASYRMSIGSQTPLDRMMDDVQNRLNQNLKDKQDMQLRYGYFAALPDAEIPSEFKDGVTQLRKLMQEEINLKTAQSRLAQGDMNIGQYLAPVMDPTSTNPGMRDLTPQEFQQYRTEVERRIPRNMRDNYYRNAYKNNILSLNDLKKLGVSP